MTTVESIQLPHWKSNNSAPDYFRFFLDFHGRYFLGEHYVILDVERSETLKKILLDLQDVAMKTRNFHYLIASYVRKCKNHSKNVQKIKFGILGRVESRIRSVSQRSHEYHDSSTFGRRFAQIPTRAKCMAGYVSTNLRKSASE